MEISELLNDFAAFSHFDEERKQRLAACAWRQTFDSGAFVFRQGDPSREPFALISGSIGLRIDSPAGEFALGELTPGQLFGEANYIDHQGRSSDAVAREACELLLFDADRLAAMADNDAGFELVLLWSFWPASRTSFDAPTLNWGRSSPLGTRRRHPSTCRRCRTAVTGRSICPLGGRFFSNSSSRRWRSTSSRRCRAMSAFSMAR